MRSSCLNVSLLAASIVCRNLENNLKLSAREACSVVKLFIIFVIGLP